MIFLHLSLCLCSCLLAQCGFPNYLLNTTPHPLTLELDGEKVETVADFIFGAPKSLQMAIAAMKLKDTYSLVQLGRWWAAGPLGDARGLRPARVCWRRYCGSGHCRLATWSKETSPKRVSGT